MSFPRYVRGVMCRAAAPAAVVVLVAFALACGEEEALPQTSDTPTASPSLATATATPSPEAAATSSPAASPGGKAPDGCLSTERAYVDPAGRFAFCYPSDMELILTDSGHGPAPTVGHREETNRVTIVFVWQPDLRPEPCLPSYPLQEQNKVVRDFVLSNKTGKACYQDHYERDKAGNPTTLVKRSIDIQVPIASGNVYVYVALTGPDWVRQGVAVDDIASRALDSAVIY